MPLIEILLVTKRAKIETVKNMSETCRKIRV